MFIEQKGKELIEKHLYRNFLLHCCNMHEYNVLSPGQVFTAVTQIQRFIMENNLQHHLSHWKEQQKCAFDQKGKPVSLDTSNLGQPLADVSPNCQRSDFSGIFKKESKTNIDACASKDLQQDASCILTSAHSLDNSIPLLIPQDQNRSKLEQISGEALVRTAKDSSTNKLTSISKNSSKGLLSTNAVDSNGSLVTNSSVQVQDNVNGYAHTNDDDKSLASKEIYSDKIEKNNSSQTNGMSKNKSTTNITSKSSVTSTSSDCTSKNTITSTTISRNSAQLSTTSSSKA